MQGMFLRRAEGWSRSDSGKRDMYVRLRCFQLLSSIQIHSIVTPQPRLTDLQSSPIKHQAPFSIGYINRLSRSFVLGNRYTFETMAPIDIVLKSPTSPQPPGTPPSSPQYMPEDSPVVQVPPQIDSIGRLEHTVEKLLRALEKLDAKNKMGDAKLEATKHVEAEKPKVRASRLEYKLVDEVYVGSSVATILLTRPAGIMVHPSTKSWTQQPCLKR